VTIEEHTEQCHVNCIERGDRQVCAMEQGGGLDKKDYIYNIKNREAGGATDLVTCDSLLATPSGERRKKTSSCAR